MVFYICLWLSVQDIAFQLHYFYQDFVLQFLSLDQLKKDKIMKILRQAKKAFQKAQKQFKLQQMT